MPVKEPISMSRQDLYERVWANPVDHVAKELGISNVGLAKMCRRHEIPVPPRGYWARKAYGQRLNQPDLPPASNARLNYVTFQPPLVAKSLQARPDEPPELAAARRHETASENRIVVPSRLPRVLHPVVAKSREAIISPKGYSTTDASYHPLHGCLHISVSRPQLDRACRILDSLMRAFDLRGYEIRTPPRHYPTGGLAPPYAQGMVLGEAIDFRILEPGRKTWSEASRSKAASLSNEAVGPLVLEIDEYGEGERRRWTDTNKRALEDCLNEFIIGLMAIALVKRKWTREREERERQWREQEERKRIEIERRELLANTINDFISTQSLREFLEAVEVARTSEPEQAVGCDDYLDWCRQYEQSRRPIQRFFNAIRELSASNR
jgi:hypothetical protein